MRLLIANIMVTALFMFSAVSANAVSFILTTDYDGVSLLGLNDTVTVTVTLDATDLSGGTDTTVGWASDVSIDGSIWTVDPGGFQDLLVFAVFFPSFGAFGGVPLVSPLQPSNTLDQNVVRMGIWFDATPHSEPGFDLLWASEVLATVTLRVANLPTGPGASVLTNLTTFFASGSFMDLNGSPLAGVNFNTVQVAIATIPEPTTTLLLGLGLAGLAATGRRAAQ